MSSDGRSGQKGGLSIYTNLVTLMGLAMIVLGCALIAVTLTHGFHSEGLLIGLLFIGAGAGRLWMIRRKPL